MQKQQGPFYIIPSELAESGDSTKALLYGCISSLAEQKGYCWASNKYLAQKIGVKSDRLIRKLLTELAKDGWIILENRTSKKRTIKLITRLQPGTIVPSQNKQPGTTVPSQPGTTVPQSSISRSKISINTSVLATAVAEPLVKQLTPLREIVSYFKGQVNQKLGFTPEVNWAKDGKLLKGRLKTSSLDEIKNQIDYYIQSPKSSFHLSLSTALSGDTYNNFKNQPRIKFWSFDSVPSPP